MKSVFPNHIIQGKVIKQAKLIIGKILLRGFRELVRDDVLSRVDFDELACQIFDDSAAISGQVGRGHAESGTKFQSTTMD